MRPSLWFVVPAHGRAELAAICLRQLRRTCDALNENGIDASAVVVADDGNLRTARNLGFATIRQNNDYLSRKFNDGIQAALDPHLTSPPKDGIATYQVVGQRRFRGHQRGQRFQARIDRPAERRALERGDIRFVRREQLKFPNFAPSAGWGGEPADYVVPMGSDDWIDWRILTSLPRRDTVLGFQWLSFVREDGREISKSHANYTGGCGMRVYPRQVMEILGYRPADEDRKRACDTSILVNLQRAYEKAQLQARLLGLPERKLRVVHGDTDHRQIVDWKTAGEQLNTYAGVAMWKRAATADPFAELADIYPAESLAEMAAHYARARHQIPVAV